MKTAVITGGSSGLGLSLAENLGLQGYRVVLIARNEEKLEKASALLKSKNIEVTYYACDVTDSGQLSQTATQIKEQSGNIDFLVLSAGIVTVKLLSDYRDTDEMMKDINVDLIGSLFSVYHFQDLLSPGAKVLFISSGFGLMGAAGYTMYCTAKAGIINFADAWRREVLHRGIKVYVAAPADVDTPMLTDEIASQPKWMKEQSAPRKPLPADIVAKRILKGTNRKRMIILPSLDVKMLYLLGKLLPQRLMAILLDKLFPLPGEN